MDSTWWIVGSLKMLESVNSLLLITQYLFRLLLLSLVFFQCGNHQEAFHAFEKAGCWQQAFIASSLLKHTSAETMEAGRRIASKLSWKLNHTQDFVFSSSSRSVSFSQIQSSLLWGSSGLSGLRRGHRRGSCGLTRGITVGRSSETASSPSQDWSPGDAPFAKSVGGLGITALSLWESPFRLPTPLLTTVCRQGDKEIKTSSHIRLVGYN